ncbi:MAG: bifunctional adenosylcobinamide kinase/adenosylcobinamide-phosphate guanylyltransferase [Pseudomonadota bacterium]|nr:bifunctional adenosylcobinamide kinase/adenosylcobinamide-phosphate guanylyltransferase [Pseudomonadota bacterium]
MRNTSQPSVTLVLGGARSGKSAYSERLAESVGGPLTYIATAEAGDDEMAARIADHQARRGNRWATVEEPLELAEAVARADQPGGAVLVDCLTLWLANLMAAERDIPAESRRLADTLETVEGAVVLVANEVGLGIVPDDPQARAFRDHAGRLNQSIAQVADNAVFVAAGLPMILKGEDLNA